ncbi:prostatic acid phosphatase-like [Sitodiplosis mosellana]|uniref:prostatic acid phosphatase-like n=1 Tax=Sitodiplosis mosellana TaxID=263140 RepID=UPI002443A7CF|nr:prostatic acid phosphatase-like [Sitodiplosis mosellana]
MCWLWIVMIFSSLYLLADASRSSRNTKNETVTSNEPKLIFAHVIFRHGDRNPLSTYASDPKSNWPGGLGALTNLGIEQEYELGKYLRRRYASLLGDGHYSNDNVYVQSTDVDRTLMSAAANLAGLFPPDDNQVWNRDINWRPIPIHSIPLDLDYVLYVGKPCPRYDHAMEEYLNSSEHANLIAKYKEMFTYLEENSGVQIRTFDDAQLLYNTLWIENQKNKGLPLWAEEEFLEKSDFEWVANHYFQIPTNTSLLARLSNGFFIREILEHFEQKINGSLSPNRSLFLYSAHDSTIANVLNSLGLFDPHNPPYASSVYFELYQSNDEYYMQIVYRNTSDENPLPLEIPNCGTKCTLKQFKSIYSAIIPTETFEEECQLPLYLRILEGNDIIVSYQWVIVMICIVCLMPFVAVISWKLLSRNRGNIVMENDNLKYL